MYTEDIEEIKIRDFLKNLTVEDIADSVHLVDIDFETCDINDVVEAMYSLFLEYLKLKKMVKTKKVNKGDKLFCEYEVKKKVLDKLRSCNELDDLLVEKAFNDYEEKVILKKV